MCVLSVALLPDIWAVLIQPQVTYQQYLPPVYKARERTEHCNRKYNLYLPFFSTPLPSLHHGVIPVQLP